MGNCFRCFTGCDDSDSDSDRVSGYHPVPSYGADDGGRRPGHPAPVPSYGADHGGRRPGHSAPVPSYKADHGGRRPGHPAPVPSYEADHGGRRPGHPAPVPSFEADHGGRRPGHPASVPSYGADHGGRRPGHPAPVPSYKADHGCRRPGHPAPVPSYEADHGGRRPGHPAPVPSYGADHGGRRPWHPAPVPSYDADHGGHRPGHSAPVPSYGADHGGRRPVLPAPVPSYGADHGGRRPGHPAPPASFAVNIDAFQAVPRDLGEFEHTNKVPEALSDYASASKATQIIWYTKLLAAWKRANPRPSSAEAVALLIVQTLQEPNIQGLLDFYRLTWPKNSGPANEPEPEVIRPEAGATWPKDVKFEIRTLPVEEARVGDGDGFVAFVDVYKDSREKENLPMEIEDAMNRRQHAKAQKNGKLAKDLKKQIEDGKYKVFDGKGGGGAQCLAREYRIRLRGVDAPEIGQAYGEEAKEKLIELVKGHKLLIHIYGKDDYDRWLGDVYQKDTFIQEVLLKEGSVWHYKFFDKCKNFAKWERDAKVAGLGLWADINPKEPWTYRREQGKKGGSFRKKAG